jgi:hypothetical protein
VTADDEQANDAIADPRRAARVGRCLLPEPAVSAA